MAFDIHKNYPHGCLEDSYKPKDGEGIIAGMMVKFDANAELIKASGVAGEYAMIATIDQPVNFFEQGGKVQVVKENASLMSNQFVQGPVYNPHDALQVSVTPGEEGLITKHTGGAAPIIGRFLDFKTIDDITYLLFDLVRA